MNRVLALALVATLVTACGGGGGGESTPVSITPEATTAPAVPSVPEAANVSQLTVDSGPSGTGTYNVNRLYTTVRVCSPGSTTQCQDIDHVLVDTGSVGVRLLASVLKPGLNLSWLKGTSDLPLLNCVQFADHTVAWGPVSTADIKLGGMMAASVPIQVIGEPVFNTLLAPPPPALSPCSGDAMTTADVLGANGIIGIGLFKDDCGADCAASPHNGSYFTCTDDSCTATKGAVASLAHQVKHPVPMFTTDNNGVLIELPAVKPPGLASLSGSLIFGIGTQSNNQLASGTGTVLTADISTGYITTRLGAQSLTKSFIDSGSNGLFFDSKTILKCVGSPGFYCPVPSATLSATLVDANGVSSPVLSFSVDNATTLFASRTNADLNHVFPTLAGDFGDAQAFDWGLPFFYGRRVFFGIKGQPSTLGTGPFYAF